MRWAFKHQRCAPRCALCGFPIGVVGEGDGGVAIGGDVGGNFGVGVVEQAA